MKLSDLNTAQRQRIISSLAISANVNVHSAEKDWWVTQVLKAVFSLPYAEHLSFKGGTSLSKCWHLIDRFSEDIDIAISRDFLGYGGDLSRTQISDKLRRAACSFVREKMQFDLRQALMSQGISANMFTVNVKITPVTTTDPETIEVEYRSALPDNNYVHHCVLIEVSGRSMQEPVCEKEIQSFLDEYAPQAIVAETPFLIPRVVVPERTFLEKVFLLHEEFAKPQADVRVNRMSRHLFDINAMIQAGVAERALRDEELYRSIIAHRRKFINLKGFDYNQLSPDTISIIPPEKVIDLWKKDYEQMQRSMIYGDSPTFDQLIQSISHLQNQLHQLPFTIS